MTLESMVIIVTLENLFVPDNSRFVDLMFV